MTVSPDVARVRFARFIARALTDARDRGMTDIDIKTATGIGPSTFHRWRAAEGGVPKLEKVVAFCTGLDIPADAALAALGVSPRDRAPEPGPTIDPDLRRLARILADPNVSEAEKLAIRHTIRMLSRASSSPEPIEH